MAHDVRFILLNGDEAFATELRALLLRFEGAKIVAEIDEPALLQQAVRQFPADIVMVNLDPVPDGVLTFVGELAASHSHLAIFAVSQSSDGQLILKAMRLGLREFFPRPIDEHALSVAIEKVASQRSEGGTHGRLITVVGSAGGVGATFLAANLAVELAQLNDGAVTLVDLDYRFGQIATLLDVEPTYTVADLCQTPEALEVQLLQKALVKHPSGVQVLSSPHSNNQDPITAASCVGLLSALLQINKYVVTDGPNRFDMTAHSVLAMSDITLMVVQLLVPCVRNASRILDGMRANGFNLDRTRLICNRVGRESGHLSLQDVASTLGIDAIATIPDDWAAVSGSINLGEPMLSHNPKSKVRLAVQEMAHRLHRPDRESDDKDSRKKGGLIGRIFAGT